MISFSLRKFSVLVALAVFSAGLFAEVPASRASIASTRAHEALLLDLARVGKRLVAVGERGHIVLSDDGGANWKQAETPTRALLTTVFFLDERNGWAVGHDSTVLATKDAGNTWVLQYQAHFDQKLVDAEYDAQVESEDDAAMEGSRVASRAQRVGAALMDIRFFDRNHGVAVGAYGLLLGTDDGGANWADRSELLQNPEGWHLNGITALPDAPSTVYVVGEKGLAFISTNAGSSYSRAVMPVESSFFGVYGKGLSAYAFGLQGRLYKSVSGGSWQAIETGVTFGLNDAVEAADGKLVFVGNAGTVVTLGTDGKVSAIRRTDGKAIMAAEPVGNGLLLVGEGGAKPARIDGSKP